MLNFVAMTIESPIRPVERPQVEFSPRHWAVLQALIDGAKNNHEVAKILGVPIWRVPLCKSQICERVDPLGERPFMYNLLEAIRLGRRSDLVNTDRLPSQPKSPLTEDELTVLALRGVGLTNGDIAQKIGRGRRDVERLWTSICDKLGAKTRFQAMVLAVCAMDRANQTPKASSVI